MSDPVTPAADPTPISTASRWHGVYDELKTLVLGFALGAAFMAGGLAPAPAPSPIPPTPSPAPAPSPGPTPPPTPGPVKHAGTLFLSYIEAVDTTPQAAAIRDAAVGTDWKGLNCRWRSYTDGQSSPKVDALKTYATTLPALVIQELPPGVDPEGANMGPAIVIDVIAAPASLDAVKARIKSLRGG